MPAKTEKPEIPAPGSLTHSFKLGDVVKDKISGITGTAISRFFHSTGCDRFAIELPPVDGKPGEFVSLDAARIELVESRPEFHRDEIPDVHFELGDKVKSVHSGIAGTCCIIHVPLYGSVQADIQPEWDPKEKKMPDGFFVDAAFVEVTESYRPKPKPEKEAAAKKPQERGCSRMSHRGLNLR